MGVRRRRRAGNGATPIPLGTSRQRDTALGALTSAMDSPMFSDIAAHHGRADVSRHACAWAAGLARLDIIDSVALDRPTAAESLRPTIPAGGGIAGHSGASLCSSHVICRTYAERSRARGNRSAGKRRSITACDARVA